MAEQNTLSVPTEHTCLLGKSSREKNSQENIFVPLPVDESAGVGQDSEPSSTSGDVELVKVRMIVTFPAL
jgi:hypothetical protein